jgi:hypothetical protein
MKHLSLMLIAASLLLQANALLAQPKPDLIILRIEPPIWNDSTRIFIGIQNIGDAVSSPVLLKVWDIDASVEEAKKLGATTKQLWIFQENTERASDGQFDYDDYFEVFKEIPAIKPHEIIRVEVNCKHWIYDSNCEIGAFIDCKEVLKEKREDNNKSYFFAGG